MLLVSKNDRSRTESLRGASLRFGGLFLAILRGCVGFEGPEKTSRDGGYFVDGIQEQGFVCLRRFIKSADFSYKLQRRSSNLFCSDRWIEVKKGFDIPAHRLWKTWRRGWESNPRIKVLQTSPLPLGYRASKMVMRKTLAHGEGDKSWSGRRDLNPRLRPWQGRTLPLSYSRSPL